MPWRERWTLYRDANMVGLSRTDEAALTQLVEEYFLGDAVDSSDDESDDSDDDDATVVLVIQNYQEHQKEKTMFSFQDNDDDDDQPPVLRSSRWDSRRAAPSGRDRRGSRGGTTESSRLQLWMYSFWRKALYPAIHQWRSIWHSHKHAGINGR